MDLSIAVQRDRCTTWPNGCLPPVMTRFKHEQRRQHRAAKPFIPRHYRGHERIFGGNGCHGLSLLERLFEHGCRDDYTLSEHIHHIAPHFSFSSLFTVHRLRPHVSIATLNATKHGEIPLLFSKMFCDSSQLLFLFRRSVCVDFLSVLRSVSSSSHCLLLSSLENSFSKSFNRQSVQESTFLVKLLLFHWIADGLCFIHKVES